MSKILTEKEKKVLQRFEAHGIEEIDASQVSFTEGNNIYKIDDAAVFKIKGSSSVLIFGDLKKQAGLNEIKKWLEDEMKNKKTSGSEKSNKATEIELSGENNHELSGENNLEELFRENKKEEELIDVSESDIKLIMDQTKTTREIVIEALKRNNNDVINALVELAKNK